MFCSALCWIRAKVIIWSHCIQICHVLYHCSTADWLMNAPGIRQCVQKCQSHMCRQQCFFIADWLIYHAECKNDHIQWSWETAVLRKSRLFRNNFKQHSCIEIRCPRTYVSLISVQIFPPFIVLCCYAHLTYCIKAWGNGPISDIEPLCRIQKCYFPCTSSLIPWLLCHALVSFALVYL